MCTRPCRAAVWIWLAGTYPWYDASRHEEDSDEIVLIRDYKCSACGSSQEMVTEGDRVLES
jgi:hypothetical protein